MPIFPGWEIPKYAEFFTNRYGLITDYLAEYMREMRKLEVLMRLINSLSWVITSTSVTSLPFDVPCRGC